MPGPRGRTPAGWGVARAHLRPALFGPWLRRLWAIDWVRGPLLLLYYLGLIYAMVQIYGGAQQQAPPPFIYQGF